MTIVARAIATQGLGYSARLVAVQGLWPVDVRVSFGGGWRIRAKIGDWLDDDEVMQTIKLCLEYIEAHK